MSVTWTTCCIMAKLRRAEPSRSSAKATVQRLFRSSAIRNKLKRHEVFQREKTQRSKDKRERREQRKKEREMLGDEVSLDSPCSSGLSIVNERVYLASFQAFPSVLSLAV